MLKPVDQKTLQAAVKALKIDVPIYSATRIKGGNIQIVTRNGIQTWKPPTRKRKAQTPQRTRGKAHLQGHEQAQTGTSAAKPRVSKDDLLKSGGTT